MMQEKLLTIERRKKYNLGGRNIKQTNDLRLEPTCKLEKGHG